MLLCLGLAGCATTPRGDAAASNPGPESHDMDSQADTTFRAVSFNIRYPNRDDGPDYWGNRRHRVVQTLERLDPDVFGVQEAYRQPARYLHEQLDGYAYIGVGRDDGEDRGEMTAVFYRTARFELRDHGHLWLSDTPDVPGSVGWDASMTRMATWLVLEDRNTQQRWLVVNAHFDHRGLIARTESAKLLSRFIQDQRAALGGAPAILMGDFNSGVETDAYAALCGPEHGEALLDSLLTADHREPLPEGAGEGTFNSFRDRTDSPRIDWVLVSPGVLVQAAGIDHGKVDGRNPSDHFPVWADLRHE
ncbi:MAG: endonuclease/exonuclease/phosphatase family protein [Phycisphaerales bacterium JB063]